MLDSAKQALVYYKESRENLKVFAKSTTHYAGIIGLAYQTNFFDPLLKSIGFKGYSESSIDKMKFIEKKYSLPLSVTAGASYNLKGMLNLAMDISYEPVDDKKLICFGTEFWPLDFFALRAGYLFQAVETLYNSNETVSNSKISAQDGLGGGIGLKVFGYNLDYAIVPYKNFGATHRLSFQTKF